MMYACNINFIQVIKFCNSSKFTLNEQATIGPMETNLLNE